MYLKNWGNIMFCYIFVFAALIDKASLLVTVWGFVGGSVVLPCSSDDYEHKLQDVDVSWRHNGSKNVCDLIPHSNLTKTQDVRYKNRTETFPEEYNQRNFSIKLSNLTHADAGRYICFITPSDEMNTVELIINEKLEPVTENANKTIDQKNLEEIKPDSLEKSWLWILIGLPILVLLIIVIIFRRKISSCLTSGKHVRGSEVHEVSPGPGYKSVTADGL
ncbi:uncharacterized protein LOC122327156 isoform X2 [Puntigrus tetrazona]|uniref:uncharacterized protein LOC122327156 isoform X1 n=1 Tax=Puntigrus tetrazona TaxID=1606681 RepID=UPI001C8AFFD8|nr:uncharacterized protein LOC122327156 isoform X1 [Puntigrus tetrazona]XP_043078284.1 uncharacterized protein LOC122327156 isoform X2 [Puntigrus tetrazona]